MGREIEVGVGEINRAQLHSPGPRSQFLISRQSRPVRSSIHVSSVFSLHSYSAAVASPSWETVALGADAIHTPLSPSKGRAGQSRGEGGFKGLLVHSCKNEWKALGPAES